MPQNTEPTGQPQQPQDRNVASEAAALNQAFPTSKPVDRRHAPRLKYQVVATLEPVSPNGPDDVQVVTRDASAKGSGFVSNAPLPEGSRAVLHLPGPDADGEPQRIECRVRRSREIGNGLFEGSVEFLGAQPQFSETRIRPTPVRPR
jgi:hypothetical protein